MSPLRSSERLLLVRATRALGWALLLCLALVLLRPPQVDRGPVAAPRHESPPSLVADPAPAHERGERVVSDERGAILVLAEVPAKPDPGVTPSPPDAFATAFVARSPADDRVSATADRAPTATVTSPVSVGRDAEPDSLEMGVFELVVERVPERTMIVVLVNERGDVFMPLRELLERVEIPVASTPSGMLLEWPRDVWRTELDLDEGMVRVGDETWGSLEPGSYHVRDGALYLTAPAVESLIGGSVRVLWSDVLIHVAGEDYPVVVRQRRELRRSFFGDRGMPGGTDPFASTPFEARTGGLAGSWGVNAFATEGQPLRGTGRVALGTSLWGGATDVSATASFVEGRPADVGDVMARFSRPVFGSDWLSRFDVGSVSSGGLVPRRLVGGMITNEPYLQPTHFSATAIAPVVPSGWDYEVYQGDHLVGVSDGTGPDDIQAAVRYGHTPVRVKLLGPAGQEVVEDLLFVVNPRQVPAGRLRYEVAAGACRDTGCSSHAAADVRYGVDDRLTLGAGAERLDLGGAGEAGLGYHLSAVARPLTNLSTDVKIRPGSFLQAGAQYRASDGTSATASYLRHGADEIAGGVPSWQGRLSVSGSTWLPGGRRGVSAHLFLRGDDPSRVEAWRAGVSTTVGRSFVTADVESGLQATEMLTLSTYTPLRRGGSVLRDLAINAAFAVSASRAETLETGLSFRPTLASSLQAGIRLRAGEAPRFSLSFTTRASAAFAQARTVASERSSASMSLDGGVALGASEGAAFFNLPGTGQAGVGGRVFLDLNGNGRLDDGEPGAAGVPVTVGGHRQETKSDGSFRSWGLRPYEPALVQVDSLSLDFHLKPAEAEIVVRPSPNRFETVDVPLVRTREVTGRVRGGGSGPVGGVMVEVVDEAGQVIVAGRTFSDGEIYLQRVPVGSYTLRVADSSLRALGASGSEAPVVVPAEGDDVVDAPALDVVFDR